jgi:hypothetical protein
MSFYIELRDNKGKVLGRAGEHASNTNRGYLPPFDPDEFPLLKYADPYGDTMFNTDQMVDLIPELERLRELAKHDETRRMIDGIIELARLGAEEPGRQMWWIGD